MLLRDLDAFFSSTFELGSYVSVDASLNGLQVERASAEIRRVAFAVDACMEVFQRAADQHADLMFVHHGIFWGSPVAVRRSHFARLRFLIEKDLSLYAVHLPLDLHLELGNNARIARTLGLEEISPFGLYRGVKIGTKGRFAAPKTLDEVIRLLGLDRSSVMSVLPFGKERVCTVGIVSGGGSREIEQAVAEELDLYITGDASHTMYHYCLEEKIDLICAGHYHTETFGVRAVAGVVEREFGLETVFVDVPTGL